jgi:hypothetical protein
MEISNLWCNVATAQAKLWPSLTVRRDFIPREMIKKSHCHRGDKGDYPLQPIGIQYLWSGHFALDNLRAIIPREKPPRSRGIFLSSQSELLFSLLLGRATQFTFRTNNYPTRSSGLNDDSRVNSNGKSRSWSSSVNF